MENNVRPIAKLRLLRTAGGFHPFNDAYEHSLLLNCYLLLKETGERFLVSGKSVDHSRLLPLAPESRQGRRSCLYVTTPTLLHLKERGDRPNSVFSSILPN